MNEVTVVKWLKAHYIRYGLHRFFGFMSRPLLLFAYMNYLSKWYEDNKAQLDYNDFYNPKIKHSDRTKLYEFVSTGESLQNAELNYIEFGVGRGRSMQWWSSHNLHPQSRFFGFDTFEGLPENWGMLKKGSFSLEGNFPDIQDDRVTFIKGLFQDTLSASIDEKWASRKIILHIDGDLYSSGLYPLAMMHALLKKDDVVIFDEFGVPLHEFRAYMDFIKSFPVKLQPIGAINNLLQVAFKVL